MKNVLIFTILCLCMLSCKEDEVIDPIYRGDLTLSDISIETDYKSKLEGKTEIHGTLRIKNIEDIDDIDLSFLKSITRVVGEVDVASNKFLDLSFLSGLKKVEGNLTIELNDKLLSLEGLENLQEVEELELRDNNSSINIDVIKNVKVNKTLILTYIDGPIPVFSNINTLLDLSVHALNGIMDYSFLINLVEVEDGVYLYECENVLSLDGLQNLKKTKSFRSSFQTELSNISALEGLESVSEMSFYGSKLSDFCPLKNILSNSSGIDFSVVDCLVNPTAEEIIANCP